MAASPDLPANGTVRPVTRWGTDVMHRPQQPVTEFDDDLRTLVADMVATMYAAEGVGLAACQIGVDRSVFVFDCPDDTGTLHQGVVCNPRLQLPEGRDRKLDDGDEGCLSFPGAFVALARPDVAVVEGQRRVYPGRVPAPFVYGTLGEIGPDAAFKLDTDVQRLPKTRAGKILRGTMKAIADSKAMVVLVSAASNKSQHVSREVNLALGKVDLEPARLPLPAEQLAEIIAQGWFTLAGVREVLVLP